MAIVKIGWSGGKDSTRSVMAHIQRGDKVKAVGYVPMFTKEIPLISKKHYDFILKTAEYFRSLGAEVYFADGGLTYYEYVTHIAKKVKTRGRFLVSRLWVVECAVLSVTENSRLWLCAMLANMIMRVLVSRMMKNVFSMYYHFRWMTAWI